MYGVSKTVNNMIRRNIVNQTIRYKRNLANRNRAIDPGIQNRKRLVNEGEELNQLDDYDFDLEADFMNVTTTHKEFEDEQRFLKEKDKRLIVKEKYFKEKLPNFLTWSDKEQIRYLHKTNPEEWTLERLSEGFPALPEVIAKIIKSEWTKSNNKILNHDQSVKQNWALFKEGKLSDLPPNLADHLKKFSKRDLNFRSCETSEFKTTNVNSMIAPNVKLGSEFSDIIRSYERLKNKNKSDRKQLSTADNSKVEKPPMKDTYLVDYSDSKKYGRHTTLHNLQQQVQEKAKYGKVSEDEELILRELEEKQSQQEKLFTGDVEIVKDLQQTIVSSNVINNKYNEIVTSSSGTKKPDNNTLDYPNRIKIPKNKYKKDYTYKLNDCYYDDDGEFLYRIPGMYK